MAEPGKKKSTRRLYDGEREEMKRAEERKLAAEPLLEAERAVAPPVAREFVMGHLVCFCFRRPDPFTMSKILNGVTSCLSYYIHCDVCVVSADRTQTRTLYISADSGRVVFEPRVYRDGMWSFLWCRLTNERRAGLQRVIAEILAEPRVFSRWNIFCFPLFAMPCYCQCTHPPRTRTCTEMTMEVIWRTWGLPIAAPFSYTPEDVYQFVQYWRGTLGVIEQLNDRNPSAFINVKTGSQTRAT